MIQVYARPHCHDVAVVTYRHGEFDLEILSSGSTNIHLPYVTLGGDLEDYPTMEELI